MNPTLTARLVNAAVEAGSVAGRRDLYRAFRWSDRPAGYALAGLLLVGVLVLSVAGWVALKRLMRHLRLRRHAGDLFRRLVREHRLTQTEEIVLRSAATRMGLRDPAVVFVKKSELTALAAEEHDPTLEGLIEKLF